jgi:hypothetical protein
MDKYSNQCISSMSKDQSGASIDVVTHVSEVWSTVANQILEVTSQYAELQPFALFVCMHIRLIMHIVFTKRKLVDESINALPIVEELCLYLYQCKNG